MKKLFLSLALIFTLPLSSAAATVSHTAAEPGLSFKTFAAWEKQTVAGTPVGTLPGWTVTVHKDDPVNPAPVSILAVDGGENQVYQDMSADFQNNKTAGNQAELIIQDNRVQQNQKGYQITNYRLEKFGRINFLIITSENPRQKLRALQAITFFNNHSYTVATKINLTAAPDDIKDATGNFLMIVSSLADGKKPAKK